MIERKFRELVEQLFDGNTSPTEIAWITEELQRKRERRDLFIELVEEFLEDYPAKQGEAEPYGPLRRLLLRDLSRITESDLHRAAPSAPRGRTEVDLSAAEVDSGPQERRRKRLDPGEISFENREIEPEEGSRIGPLVCVLVLAVIAFMVSYASLESDPEPEKTAEEPQTKDRDGLPDASLIRRANEMLTESHDSSSGQDPKPENEDTGASSFSPQSEDFDSGLFSTEDPADVVEAVSLSDLVGEFAIESVDGEADTDTEGSAASEEQAVVFEDEEE